MRLLFADDEKTIREVMEAELKRLGNSVTICGDGLAAIERMKKEAFDVLIVDLDMPGASGLEVIEHARELNPDADTVILTGKGSFETAVTAIRKGVSDYLTKPYKIVDLELLLRRIAEKRELKKSNLAMKNQLRRIEGERRLIGDSPAMQQVQRLIDKIAQTESTVVILGETGTGKELAARAVHDRSSRREKTFVAINCGALPENLIESELFGHRKGSFTGADANRAGLLEVANGGTLFLDEIGELPKGVQAKLLRFLESGEVRRIGENTSTTCDVRVVCATLRNLESMVRSGDFREDLWFRINTFEIHLPPLRDRLKDLPELIDHLAKRFPKGRELKAGATLFTPDALRLLEQYDWPGNVRQLANTIEHALILSDKPPIGVDALPQTVRPRNEKFETVPNPERIKEKKPNRPIVSKASDSSASLSAVGSVADLMSFDPTLPEESTTLRDLEMKAILTALARHEGNKVKAAEELGISLKTLYNKLNQSDAKRTA